MLGWTAGILMLAGAAQSGDYIQDLQNQDESIREAAARICGRKGIKTAIPYLIEGLNDVKEPVRSASWDALKLLTGKKELEQEYRVWKDWWDTEGSKDYPATNLTRQQIVEILEPRVERLKDDLEKDVKRAKWEIRMVAFVVVGIGLFFIAIMFYFVGHVSSRLKEWKDFIKQAEGYIKKGEEINSRTDQVIDELEAKKYDILDFVRKQREEVQSEIERYTDLKQESLEHQMREEVMALRQKAEKELEQTLGDLRKGVEYEIRRAAGGSREMLEADYAMQRDRFLQEAQSHTIFLEARFYAIQGKPEDALRQYKRLVALKPDHYIAWMNMGDTYRDMLRHEEALEAYEKALLMAPSDSRIHYNIASTYAQMKQKESMIDALKMAIANDGEYKDEALNDSAFREYWNDPVFKDLAEG